MFGEVIIHCTQPSLYVEVVNTPNRPAYPWLRLFEWRESAEVRNKWSFLAQSLVEFASGGFLDPLVVFLEIVIPLSVGRWLYFKRYYTNLLMYLYIPTCFTSKLCIFPKLSCQERPIIPNIAIAITKCNIKQSSLETAHRAAVMNLLWPAENNAY